MAETEISIDAGAVTLAASLARPVDGPARGAALFLHGSGPLDRDENIASQKLNVFNVLAADLAQIGIASIRYDKRGCGRSSGVYHDAGQTELLDDARAALHALRREVPGVPIFLVGHSEGTLMGVRLSLDETVDGLVLLTPFLQKLEPMLRGQAGEAEKAIAEMKGFGGWLNRMLLRIIGSPRTHQDRLIARLKSGTETSFRYIGRRIEAKSLRELLALDPAEIYPQVRVPMLVLGGGKDVQCNPEDVHRIAAIVGPLATPVLIDDLTHILRRDEGPAGFGSYARLIAQPLDAGIRQIVADWIAERLEARPR